MLAVHVLLQIAQGGEGAARATGTLVRSLGHVPHHESLISQLRDLNCIGRVDHRRVLNCLLRRVSVLAQKVAIAVRFGCE